MADREMHIMPAPPPPWVLSWLCCLCGLPYLFHQPEYVAEPLPNQHPICPYDVHPCCQRCVRFWSLPDRDGTWAPAETVWAPPLPWELLWDCRACGAEGRCWTDDGGRCACRNRARRGTARFWCDVPPPPLEYEEEDDDDDDDEGFWVLWEGALYDEWR